MFPKPSGGCGLGAPLGVETVKSIEGCPSFREAVLNLQNRLMEFPQVDLPLRHHFAEGQYGREIFIPKGMLVVGKIHKHSHVNIISMGDVTVATEFGVQRLKAPCTFVSKPGTKRALYTHEDTIWTTVHVTEETDLGKIESEIIATTYAAFDELAFTKNLQTLAGGVE